MRLYYKVGIALGGVALALAPALTTSGEASAQPTFRVDIPKPVREDVTLAELQAMLAAAQAERMVTPTGDEALEESLAREITELEAGSLVP